MGKFDALHIGHRELAIQASRAGHPFLLSFVGMAKVLGWEHRYDVVYVCIKPIRRFILFVYMGGRRVWLLHSCNIILHFWLIKKMIWSSFLGSFGYLMADKITSDILLANI